MRRLPLRGQDLSRFPCQPESPGARAADMGEDGRMEYPDLGSKEVLRSAGQRAEIRAAAGGNYRHGDDPDLGRPRQGADHPVEKPLRLVTRYWSPPPPNPTPIGYSCISLTLLIQPVTSNQ